MAASKKAAKKAKGGKAKVKAVRAPRIERNGMKRPNPGTAGDKIWSTADSLTSRKGRPATRAEVVEAVSAKGVNEKSAASGYQRWRTFNGLEGRLSSDGSKRKAKAGKAAKKAKGKAKAKPAAKKAAPKKAARKAPAKKAPAASAPAPAPAADAAAAG